MCDFLDAFNIFNKLWFCLVRDLWSNSLEVYTLPLGDCEPCHNVNRSKSLTLIWSGRRDDIWSGRIRNLDPLKSCFLLDVQSSLTEQQQVKNWGHAFFRKSVVLDIPLTYKILSRYGLSIVLFLSEVFSKLHGKILCVKSVLCYCYWHSLIHSHHKSQSTRSGNLLAVIVWACLIRASPSFFLDSLKSSRTFHDCTTNALKRCIDCRHTCMSVCRHKYIPISLRDKMQATEDICFGLWSGRPAGSDTHTHSLSFALWWPAFWLLCSPGIKPEDLFLDTHLTSAQSLPSSDSATVRSTVSRQ